MWLLPLVFLVLFAQQAVGGLVYCLRHVVFTPVVSVFAHFFLTLFTILWSLFLPGFILLLFPSVVSILLVLLLLVLLLPFSFPSLAIALSLGSNLSWPLSALRAAVIATIFFVVWGFCLPESLGLQPIKSALPRCHEGLVGDGGKFTIEVIPRLTANVRLEVVAGNHQVSFEQDDNGVVDGCIPGN
jgi:hypothetical protein